MSSRLFSASQELSPLSRIILTGFRAISFMSFPQTRLQTGRIWMPLVRNFGHECSRSATCFCMKKHEDSLNQSLNAVKWPGFLVFSIGVNLFDNIPYFRSARNATPILARGPEFHRHSPDPSNQLLASGIAMIDRVVRITDSMEGTLNAWIR